jgi:hypothetical protein
MALDTSFVGFVSHKTSQHPWNFMVCGVVVNAVAAEEGDKSVTEAEDTILSSLSMLSLLLSNLSVSKWWLEWFACRVHSVVIPKQ